MSSSSTIVLITGANTGLGFETVKALCQSSKQYTILLGGRSLEKATAAAEKARSEYSGSPSIVVPVQIDIEDDESIAKLVDHISNTYGRLDTLLNNAGHSLDQAYMAGKVSMREAWDRAWSVNTTSTNVMTYNFVPLLLKSSQPRLVFVTSGTSTFAEHDNTAIAVNRSPEQGWPKKMIGIPAYRSSKAGMNMMMLEWDRTLKEDGVKVLCISPGQLATGLGGSAEVNKSMGAIDPAIGGQFVLEVLEGGRDADCAKVVRRAGVQPW